MLANCPTDSPKPKDNLFAMIENTKKQQILTCNKLELVKHRHFSVTNFRQLISYHNCC